MACKSTPVKVKLDANVDETFEKTRCKALHQKTRKLTPKDVVDNVL